MPLWKQRHDLSHIVKAKMCVFTQHTYGLADVSGLRDFMTCMETGTDRSAGGCKQKREEPVAHLRSDGEVLWTHGQNAWPGGRAGARRKPHVTRAAATGGLAMSQVGPQHVPCPTACNAMRKASGVQSVALGPATPASPGSLQKWTS